MNFELLKVILWRGETCEPDSELRNFCTRGKTRQPITLAELRIGEQVTSDEAEGLLDLLSNHRDCFAKDVFELGETSKAEVTIDTVEDARRVSLRSYPLPYYQRHRVNQDVDKLKSARIIQDSSLPYASPLVLAKKEK